jgi:branched-chain amino acid transport system substrate-binding protein
MASVQLGACFAAFVAFVAGPALAEVKIGLPLSTTGPAPSLGIPEKNSVQFFPSEIGGEKVRWIILDDATDATKAVANVRKLIFEENVDAVIGASTLPVSLSPIEVAAVGFIAFGDAWLAEAKNGADA